MTVEEFNSKYPIGINASFYPPGYEYLWHSATESEAFLLGNAPAVWVADSPFPVKISSIVQLREAKEYSDENPF